MDPDDALIAASDPVYVADLDEDRPARQFRLAARADPKVVQRMLGHASAAMTMDLYGHLIDQNLWDAAKRIDEAMERGQTGARRGHEGGFDPVAALPPQEERASDLRFYLEPVTGVEPATSSLQVRRSTY